MTFNIKNITVKNFLSVGSQTQAVDFDKEHLTLVLGENLDLGGDDSGSRNGTGKAQPLDSNILTPHGWKPMGDIKVNDEIVTASGKISYVTGVFPQGELPVYKLTFKDGRTCKATGDHLWETYSHLFNLKSDVNKTRITTTEEIIKLLNRKNTRPNSRASSYIYVPLITPLKHEDVELPIDPWLLGFLIGDGSFSNSSAGVSFTSNDPFLVEKTNLISSRDFNCTVKSNGMAHSIIMNQRTQKHPINVAIKELKLNGHLSYSKFIPDIYKSASISQKLELLQGLIDSDGTVDRRTGSITFTTVSETLSNDVAYLVRSIGGIAKIALRKNKSYVYKNNRKPCADSYTVNIRYPNMTSLASLPRKKNLIKQNYQYADKLRLQIVNVELIESAECQCIAIDDPSHLYVTDNFIATHNTTMINALSYGLYGQALTNIRKENLINKTNGKNMLVTVEFEVGGVPYRIERGRKPNVLKLFVNNLEQKADENQDDDDAQGDSRETQKHIEQKLGMSHTMFKHLVALNTYTEPFLSMRASDQRAVIEQLLGITMLSEKAESLKLAMKAVRDDIQTETFKIEGLKSANENVQKSINSLIIKSSAWENKKATDLERLTKAIIELSAVDIETELKSHEALKAWNSDNSALNALNKQRAMLDSALIQAEKTVTKYAGEIKTLANKTCPSCEQELHDHKHEEMLLKAQQEHTDSETYAEKIRTDLKSIHDKIIEIGDLQRPPATFYDTENEALGHKNNLSSLENSLITRDEETNPFDEQIEELKKTALQELDWAKINELTKLREHQDFLHKLLTNKDSFIRKKIIDQNLSYLNKRLSYYIDKMGLPHLVVFQNDLTVEITQLGQELDFDNLSRGERNRLILSMSFAFRDVWENLYQHINLLFVDELIDAGMDAAGVESGLSVLKKMARERNKNVFLISHKDDLVGRVNTVLRVIKENGFTSYATNSEYVGTE